MAFHIIGDQDTVLGYRFSGVTGSVVDTPEESRAAFAAAVADPENQVLLLTEKVDELLEQEVTQHRLSASPPYVVVVEDIWGGRPGRKSLHDMIFEAVGIRIVPEEEVKRGP